jgi:hypothetical protein
LDAEGEYNDQKTIHNRFNEDVIGQNLLEIIQADKNSGWPQSVPVEQTEINGSKDGIDNKKKKDNKSRQ